MTRPEQTWQEKWLAKEEGGSSGNSSSEEASKVTPPRGGDNPGLGDGNPEFGRCNPESGNCHPESGNHNRDSGNVNMVFTILAEFRAPMEDVTELTLGVDHAMFEKPENLGMHMKPLFVRDTWTRHRSSTCSLMEVQVSTSCHFRCSRSSTTSKVMLNKQILALAVLQVIQRRQKE
jgi:hypothetical protein